MDSYWQIVIGSDMYECSITLKRRAHLRLAQYSHLDFARLDTQCGKCSCLLGQPSKGGGYVNNTCALISYCRVVSSSSDVYSKLSV